MEKSANWRTQSRPVYPNDFKLHIVELASRPGANFAQIARENGVAYNLVFRWLRLWQKEGRISRRLPATITPSSSPALLPVEVIPEPASSQETHALPPATPFLASAASCRVEFRHGNMTLENPSPELLSVLIRELTGRVR